MVQRFTVEDWTDVHVGHEETHLVFAVGIPIAEPFGAEQTPCSTAGSRYRCPAVDRQGLHSGTSPAEQIGVPLEGFVYQCPVSVPHDVQTMGRYVGILITLNEGGTHLVVPTTVFRFFLTVKHRWLVCTQFFGTCRWVGSTNGNLVQQQGEGAGTVPEWVCCLSGC